VGITVAERSGSDLNPIDATTEEGRLTVLACVFPDEFERYGLLEQAIAVARETPAVVERADLASWITRRLAEPLALLAFEGTDADPALIQTRLTQWPGGRTELLAESSHHPTTVHWL
jgi:hypothetical protein